MAYYPKQLSKAEKRTFLADFFINNTHMTWSDKKEHIVIVA